MDRLEAMTAFVVTVDAGGLSAAARKLGRSPASITRAVASLEERLGVQLLRRTTRSVKLTDQGGRYLAVCRRVLSELGDAENTARGALDTPRGTLTLTAPVAFGALHVRPLVDAYLTEYGDVRASLVLLDRVVSLVEEGIDVAIRIAHLADSALVATKIGDVSKLLCASPRYLARHGRPKKPADLPTHRCIALSALSPNDTWTFGAKRGGRATRVTVRPALTVNTAEAAIGSALEGYGVACVLSYQVADALREGRLVRLLESYESAEVPVHLVYPKAAISSTKVRAFVDMAVPGLKTALS